TDPAQAQRSERDAELGPRDVVVEVADRLARDARTAAPLLRERIDAGPPRADQRELGGDEECVGQDQNEGERQTPDNALEGQRLGFHLRPSRARPLHRRRQYARLEEHRFAVGAVYVLQRTTDLVQGAVGAHALEHGLDDVLIPACGLAQATEGGLDSPGITAAAQLGEPLALPPLRLRADLEDLDVRVLVALGEGVDADDDALAGLDLLLLAFRALRD